MRRLPLLVVLAIGCRTKDISVDSQPAGDDTGVEVIDADNDGFDADKDCDDGDPAVNPDAAEVCDGVDNDCDGAVDDEDPDGATDAATWFSDQDGDGYGDDDQITQACEAPEGSAALGGDCDDGDPVYNPGAAEDDCADPNDYNCDGSVGYADDDGDGWAACEECDDGDAAVNPDAVEVCDGLDNDCDGELDPPTSVDASLWYADGDTDGYGDPSLSELACEPPTGFVANDSDCDDSDVAVNPAASEVCNAIDDDCDGLIDDPSDLLGSGADCPALDCLDAVTTLTTPADGLHWIDPLASGAAYEAYCDMGSDGGGWTLVMRCVADYIDYDDSAWTTTDLLDEGVVDFATAGCSKYEAFNEVGFSELRSSSTTDLSDDYVETFSSSYSSALTLFSGTGFPFSTTYDAYFNDMMDPYAQEWGCTSYRDYGINQRDS